MGALWGNHREEGLAVLDGDLAAWLRPSALGALLPALREIGAETPHDCVWETAYVLAGESVHTAQYRQSR